LGASSLELLAANSKRAASGELAAPVRPRATLEAGRPAGRRASFELSFSHKLQRSVTKGV